MKPVYINGIGLASPAARSPAELWTLLQENRAEEALLAGQAEVDLSSVERPRVRRASRYAKLAVAAGAMALEEAGLRDYPAMERLGTIFSTNYGPVASNVDFADTVVKGQPYLCSPTTFSYTVPNSCLGQVCIALGCKGPSTMLMGGDMLEYSALILNRGQADHILCGAVEEQNQELYDSFAAASEALAGVTLAEAAVALSLGQKPLEGAYARTAAFASASLRDCTNISFLEMAECLPVLREVLAELKAAGEPDLILDAANGSYFDHMEAEALAECFPGVRRQHVKALLGETLGAAYLLNLAAGALWLKGEAKVRRVLATGLDVQGNYLAALLEEY